MVHQSGTSESQFLDYATTMLQQLRDMARSDGREMLAYMIDMAYIEAAEELADLRRPSSVAKKHRDGAA